MFATPSSFLFLSNFYFRIPYFQRPYVWNEEQWKKLIESLTNEDDNFIGSIIIKKEKNEQGYTIVDGQQRITTICVLLRACEYILNNKDYTQAINNILFHSEATMIPAKIEEDKITLKVNHSIENDFNKIMLGRILPEKSEEPFKINKDKSLIVNCFNYFCGKKEGDDPTKIIDIITKDKAEKIYNVLLKGGVDNNNNKGACIIQIALNEDDNEQKIFNTINAEGVKLTSVDIIKNNLFYKYRELLRQEKKDDKDAFDTYDLHWKKVFEEEDIKFWEEEIATLFGYIGTIYKFFDRNKKDHKDDDLHKIYDLYINNIKDTEEIKKFIEGILNYAIIYKQYIRCNNEALTWNNKTRLTSFILENTGTNTLIPYLLKVYKKHCKWIELDNIDEDSEIEISNKEQLYCDLKIICSVAFRFCLSYEASKKIKNFNKKIFSLIDTDINNFANELKKDDNGNDADISDANFEKGLTNYVNNSNGKLTLYLIELYRRSNDSKSPQEDLLEIKNYSLEHIIPQEYTTYWNVLEHPVFTIDGEKINDENLAKDQRYKLIYSIGNMLLLTGPQNTSQSNMYIDYKVDSKNTIEKGPKKNRWSAYESCNTLFITKEVVITYRENKENRELNELWDERDTRKRSNDLVNLLKKMFPVNLFKD